MEVYKGRGNSSSDVVCNIRGKEIYKGRGNSSSDVLCNIQGKEVYKGRGNSSSDVLCNIQGKEVYKGRGNSSSDVLCNIQGKEVYKGRGNSSSDVLCNIQGKEIYKGRGNSSSDVLCNTSENLGTEELVAILFTLGLISSDSLPQQASSSNASPSSFKSAKNAEELGGVLAGILIEKVIKPLSLAIFRKIKGMFKK